MDIYLIADFNSLDVFGNSRQSVSNFLQKKITLIAACHLVPEIWRTERRSEWWPAVYSLFSAQYFVFFLDTSSYIYKRACPSVGNAFVKIIEIGG